MSDWTQLIAAFTIGAFPWLSQFKKLKIHFVSDYYPVASINNFFASLFSFSVYVYFQYASPLQLIYLPEWYYFLIAALILTLIFITIFIYKKDKVEKNESKIPIVINLFIYILIFISLTSGFGLLKVYEDHYLIKGNVQDASSTPIKDVDIEVGDNISYKQITKTDKYGIFYLLVKKEKIDDIKSIIISLAGYKELKPVGVSGASSIIAYMREPIILEREDE